MSGDQSTPFLVWWHNSRHRKIAPSCPLLEAVAKEAWQARDAEIERLQTALAGERMVNTLDKVEIKRLQRLVDGVVKAGDALKKCNRSDFPVTFLEASKMYDEALAAAEKEPK